MSTFAPNANMDDAERAAMMTLFERLNLANASVMMMVKADTEGVVNHGVIVLRGAENVAMMHEVVIRLFENSAKETVN